MHALEVIPEVVGLTAERWDLVVLALGIVVFTAGFLIAVRS